MVLTRAVRICNQCKDLPTISTVYLYYMIIVQVFCAIMSNKLFRVRAPQLTQYKLLAYSLCNLYSKMLHCATVFWDKVGKSFIFSTWLMYYLCPNYKYGPELTSNKLMYPCCYNHLFNLWRCQWSWDTCYFTACSLVIVIAWGGGDTFRKLWPQIIQCVVVVDLAVKVAPSTKGGQLALGK